VEIRRELRSKQEAIEHFTKWDSRFCADLDAVGRIDRLARRLEGGVQYLEDSVKSAEHSGHNVTDIDVDLALNTVTILGTGAALIAVIAVPALPIAVMAAAIPLVTGGVSLVRQMRGRDLIPVSDLPGVRNALQAIRALVDHWTQVLQELHRRFSRQIADFRDGSYERDSERPYPFRVFMDVHTDEDVEAAERLVVKLNKKMPAGYF
jgi:hypothetical protein